MVFNLFEAKDTRNPVQVDKQHIVQHDISDSQFSVCVCVLRLFQVTSSPEILTKICPREDNRTIRTKTFSAVLFFTVGAKLIRAV